VLKYFYPPLYLQKL
jgi:hypothetical protein